MKMFGNWFGNNESTTTTTNTNTYDLMGINANGIDPIKTSIETYLSEVDKIIAKINTTNTDVSMAFKGEKQITTVNSYLNNAIQTIKGVTQEMRKFINALDKVKTNYTTQSEAINVTNVNEDTLNVTTGVHGFGD